jgi:hypothetical protein
MKQILICTSLALIFMFTVVSCGNRRSTTEQATAATGTAVVVTVAEMELSVVEPQDYCDPGDHPYVLTIKGGTPFTDEANPYKIEAAKNDFFGIVELKKFRRDGDAVSVNVYPNTNNQNEEGKTMTLVVTDASGVEKTISLFVPYCL